MNCGWMGGLAFLALAGCATAPGTGAGLVTQLDGTVWELPDTPVGRPVVIEFRGQDGGGLMVGGFDGCNRFNGQVVLAGSTVRFPNLMSTLMACEPNAAPTEQRMRAALEGTRALRVEGAELRLLDAGGQPLLAFRRQ